MDATPTPLALLAHPYRALQAVDFDRLRLKALLPPAGAALVWDLRRGVQERAFRLVRTRPGGLALILVLPPAQLLRPQSRFLEVIEATRPSAILPFHQVPHVGELAHVLRRPPGDLPAEITDYMAWRGLSVPPDIRQLIRRTVELSGEVRSVQALARGMYISRRALGRRFDSAGLPVPSHWLHFSRLLRVVLRLQNSHDSIVAAGFRVGYPDGFSLSNQMQRLTGFRPSEARKYLGWEWLLEAWLRREAEAGGLSLGDPAVAPPPEDPPPPSMQRAHGRAPRRVRGTGS